MKKFLLLNVMAAVFHVFIFAEVAEEKEMVISYFQTKLEKYEKQALVGEKKNSSEEDLKYRELRQMHKRAVTLKDKGMNANDEEWSSIRPEILKILQNLELTIIDDDPEHKKREWV